MKNLSLLLIAAVAISFASCESSRDEDDSTFSSMDSFYNQHKQQEQVFVIDTPGTDTIVGLFGTRLYVGNSIFMHQDGSDVGYPFELRLIELYPEMEVIFYTQPTVALGEVMEAVGEIKVTAFENGAELVIRPGMAYKAEMPDGNSTNSSVSLHYGFDNGGIIDWTSNLTSISSINVDTMTSVTQISGYHRCMIAQTGWASPQVDYNNAGVGYVDFTVSGSGTEFIDIFIIPASKYSVVQVYNLSSGTLPLNESATVIAMAMDQDGNFRVHKSTIVISASQTIPLDMQVKTETELLTILGAL